MKKCKVFVYYSQKIGVSLMEKNQFWVARDKNGALTLFDVKPISSDGIWIVDDNVSFKHMALNKELFNDLDFEHSPMKVALTLQSMSR